MYFGYSLLFTLFYPPTLRSWHGVGILVFGPLMKLCLSAVIMCAHRGRRQSWRWLWGEWKRLPLDLPKVEKERKEARDSEDRGRRTRGCWSALPLPGRDIESATYEWFGLIILGVNENVWLGGTCQKWRRKGKKQETERKEEGGLVDVDWHRRYVGERSSQLKMYDLINSLPRGGREEGEKESLGWIGGQGILK